MWNRPAASFQVMCPGTSDPGLRHGLSLSTSKFSPSREKPERAHALPRGLPPVGQRRHVPLSRDVAPVCYRRPGQRPDRKRPEPLPVLVQHHLLEPLPRRRRARVVDGMRPLIRVVRLQPDDEHPWVGLRRKDGQVKHIPAHLLVMEYGHVAAVSQVPGIEVREQLLHELRLAPDPLQRVPVLHHPVIQKQNCLHSLPCVESSRHGTMLAHSPV